MTTQRFVIGTVVGGLVLFFVGYLIFGILTVDFFEANRGSATGVPKDPINFVALAVGQLAWGSLLTLILNWRSSSSIGQGASIGAIVGVLVFAGIDLTLYATSNVQNMTAALADVVLTTVLFAVAGAAIAAAGASKR
jgi:uncharacterized membrane protein